jgi:uncharacterized protein
MLAILASWGIAFIKYCLAVPANRIGHAVYTTAELKTMQEVITLCVFAVFSFFYLNEPLGVESRGWLRADCIWSIFRNSAMMKTAALRPTS